jgi:hypothetical protein
MDKLLHQNVAISQSLRSIYRINMDGSGDDKREIFRWFTTLQTKYAAVFKSYESDSALCMQLPIDDVIASIKKSVLIHTTGPQNNMTFVLYNEQKQIIKYICAEFIEAPISSDDINMIM